MRAYHVAAFVGSQLLLLACGGRSPYGEDQASCDLLGGSNQGTGGNTYFGGRFSGKGGNTSNTVSSGGTKAMGGTTARGGTTALVTTGGISSRGGTANGGGYSGATATGGKVVGGASGKGGAGGGGTGAAAGVAAKGGTVNGGVAGSFAQGGNLSGGAGGLVANGGAAGNAAAAGSGISDGGTVGGAAIVAGNAGVIGMGGSTVVSEGGASNGGAAGNAAAAGSGISDGGTVGGAAIVAGNAGVIGIGGSSVVTEAGASNGGAAGSVAGASPGGAGPWNGCHCGEQDCGTCPTTPMVPLTFGSASYYIDSIETTNADYALFMAAMQATNSLSAQPSVCTWNLDFKPNVGGWPISGNENMPVNYVDWCDAYAYCAWAGKRLCGAIGGGAAPYQSYDDPAVNQWFAACTNNGASIYPYGPSYVASACNGSDYGVGTYGNERVVAAGSMSSCVVTGLGIYDMSGNVGEWEDSCGGWTGEDDICRSRGGSYVTALADLLRCRTASATLYARNTVRGSVGFRCCRD
jgi:formylglycine-generating enzyme